MHTRLNVLAARSRSDFSRRRWRHEWIHSNNTNNGKWRSHGPTYVSLVQNTRGPFRRIGQMPQTCFSSLHTTSQSLAPPTTVIQQQDRVEDEFDEDLEQEIERFTSSCLSQLLPNEIFYDEGEHAKLSSKNGSALDEELGVDSVWDSQIEENEDEGVISMEEQTDELSSGTTPMDDPMAHNASTRNNAANKTAMEILRNFDEHNPPTADDPEALQLWLECAAQREAVMRYQDLVEKARDRKAFDSMSMMKRHVVQWYQSLRDSIETRQKEYLSNEDTRRAKKRYGPFLCSLHPEKMAVILSHESITQALLLSGNNGREGVPLVKMAQLMGQAVEVEVVSQRRIKERFHDARVAAGEDGEEESESDESKKEQEESIQKKSTAMDRWIFSASHLKLFMEELNRINPKLGKSKRAINYAMRRAKQAMNSEENWTKEDLTHLGAALLSILVENATILENGKEVPAFRVEKKWSQDSKSTSYIVLNDSVHKLFMEDDFLSWAATTTRHAPMIVPPSDWVGPNEGGYRWLKVDLMRTHGSNFQREALQHGDFSRVFDGLNILGKTAWKINKEILSVAQHCWEDSVAIGDIPSKIDHIVPAEPLRPDIIDPEIYADTENPKTQAAIAANRIYRERMYKRMRVHQKNMDLRSLRCSAMLKLNQAEKFKEFENIYFPYNLDFRGRAYPVPPHLSNVGSDLCRGMLTFSDSKPLGKRGLYWLKVHLANFAGKDKMSFDDRAKYVDDNIDKVREATVDTFSDDPWWMTLDDPFQGLATCYEIIRAIDSGDPENYKCPLPVHMDGSCNGLQHYAALGRDTVGGKAVNLLEGDGPQDVYIGVMHEVIRRVSEEAATNIDFDTSNPDSLNRKQKKALKNNMAAKLVDGLIDRGVVKRTVMTSVYGVTYIGARQQIQEKIEEKLEELGHDIDEMDREIFGAAGYLATVTIEVMGDLFQGARKTKSWLAECARLVSQQGHPVAWISPIGIPAIQPYRQKRPRTVVTVMQSVTVADASDDLPVHKSRQVTAFPPNYVHSLDSSHMLLTAMEMDRRGLSFSAVHDSFWTHACDVDEMNEALRDCFVDLYSQPLLSDLKESMELRYPEIEFPELPQLGDLDLNEVKSATYFFQ